MATKWIEPGGDSDFGVGLWPTTSGTPAVATDFVHGSHIKSIKYRANNADLVVASGKVTDAGGRISVWIYINVIGGVYSPFIVLAQTGIGSSVVRVGVSSTGVLQISKSGDTQIGTNGSTLSAGVWYRLAFAWTITSTTVNEFRLFLQKPGQTSGVLDITITNATITNTSSADGIIGNWNGSLLLDFRSSDHYFDDSNALTDPGNIWVTAKRPNANGTTNGYTTQIGAGGSGYGTGHSPQVNERPNSDTNGWGMIGAGSAITEEYNIENVNQGDIDITAATIVDYMGWVRSKSLASETASIIVNGVSSNISLTSTIAFFTKIAGSTTYPARTGTDIGEITTTALTTVSLYECGIVVAYIPHPVSFKTLLGVGQI